MDNCKKIFLLRSTINIETTQIKKIIKTGIIIIIIVLLEGAGMAGGELVDEVIQ